MGQFTQFLTEMISSYAGIPVDPNSQEAINKRVHAAAIQAGYKSAQEMLFHRRGNIEIAEAQRKANLAQTQAQTTGTELDNSGKNAELFSRSGVDKGESATFVGSPDDLTRLKPSQQGAFDIAGLEAVAGLNRKLKPDSSGALRTDDFVNTEQKTRDEIVGLDLLKTREEEIDRELIREENDQNNADTMYILRKEMNKLAHTKEERYANYSTLRMDLVQAQIAQIRNDKKGTTITPGQAMSLVYALMSNSGELDEIPEDKQAGALAARGMQLIRSFKFPNRAPNQKLIDLTEEHINNVMDTARLRTNAPVPGFEDEEVEEQKFGDALKNESQQQGDAADDEEAYLDDDVPPVPPVEDGVADARALDPDISFEDLIGADPKMRAKQQIDETTADNEEFEQSIRTLQFAGTKEEEWEEYLRVYIADRRRGAGLEKQ